MPLTASAFQVSRRRTSRRGPDAEPVLQARRVLQAPQGQQQGGAVGDVDAQVGQVREHRVAEAPGVGGDLGRPALHLGPVQDGRAGAAHLRLDLPGQPVDLEHLAGRRDAPALAERDGVDGVAGGLAQLGRDVHAGRTPRGPRGRGRGGRRSRRCCRRPSCRASRRRAARRARGRRSPGGADRGRARRGSGRAGRRPAPARRAARAPPSPRRRRGAAAASPGRRRGRSAPGRRRGSGRPARRGPGPWSRSAPRRPCRPAGRRRGTGRGCRSW